MARRKFDLYETNERQTHILLDILQDRGLLTRYQTITILEPCAGNGAILEVLRDRLPHARIITNDPNPDVSIIPDFRLDMTDPESWETIRRETEPVDWVITNVPFSEAESLLPLARKHVLRGVATILPLNYLEPTGGRGDWLDHNRPDFLYSFGQPRPSYTGEGTHFITTAWYGWHRSGYQGTDIRFLMNWQNGH